MDKLFLFLDPVYGYVFASCDIRTIGRLHHAVSHHADVTVRETTLSEFRSMFSEISVSRPVYWDGFWISPKLVPAGTFDELPLSPFSYIQFKGGIQ